MPTVSSCQWLFIPLRPTDMLTLICIRWVSQSWYPLWPCVALKSLREPLVILQKLCDVLHLQVSGVLQIQEALYWGFDSQIIFITQSQQSGWRLWSLDLFLLCINDWRWGQGSTEASKSSSESCTYMIQRV